MKVKSLSFNRSSGRDGAVKTAIKLKQHPTLCPLTRQNRPLFEVPSCLFLALGINKQLDLQSALTEVGRILAQAQGWYAQREAVQLDFILLVAVACLIAPIVLIILVRRSPLSTSLALIGTAMVLCFVFIRAASFHHFDRFIGSRVFGLRWNWILEMSGISLVLLASQWRQVRLLRV
jgi:hypothetical protein